MPGIEMPSAPLPGLALFSQPTDPCPISTLGGYHKQVSRAKLSESDIRALDNVFSGFIGGILPFEKSSVPYIADLENEGITHRHDERVLRRFDGDKSLPPGRYSTLCGPDGDDNGTLTSELMAYLSPEVVEGHIQLLDSAVASHRDIAVKLGLPDEPWQRVIVRYLPFSQGAPDDKPIALVKSLEYDVSEISITNVLDLRRPDSANWFCRTLSRLYLEGKDLEGKDMRLPCFNREPLDFFPQVIYSLLDQTRGGGNFHIIAGTFLRRLGIAGLVYPSARTNASVVFQHGQPVRWQGWCYVDFRSAPVPSLIGFYEERPSWPEALVREGGDGSRPSAVAFGDQVRVVTTSYREDDGGFAVQGMDERTEAVSLAESVAAGIQQRMPANAEQDSRTVMNFLASMPVNEAMILARMTIMSFLGIKSARSDLQTFTVRNVLPEPVADVLKRCSSPSAWAPAPEHGLARAFSHFAGLPDVPQKSD